MATQYTRQELIDVFVNLPRDLRWMVLDWLELENLNQEWERAWKRCFDEHEGEDCVLVKTGVFRECFLMRDLHDLKQRRRHLGDKITRRMTGNRYFISDPLAYERIPSKVSN